MVAQRTLSPRHGRREVVGMLKTVAQSLRWGRSPLGRPKEAEGRHTHRRGRRIDAHGSAIGRPVKKRTIVNIVYQIEWCLCLPCTTSVPPKADQ